MRVLLIVDLRNLVYRATNVHPSLFSGRTFTGGIYGFMSLMLRAVQDTDATNVVVATDSPPYVRSAYFKGYKSDRAKRKEDDNAMVMKAAQTFPVVADFIATLDIPLWEVKGFEYDDLCAWGVYRYQHRFDRIIAVTNDTDLFQLFDVPGFGVYRGAAARTYTVADFTQEYGTLTRDEWIDMLSMTGTHNAVPGIHGIGPKKALKAVRGGMGSIMKEHGRLMTRNRALIELPHPDLPKGLALRTRRHEFHTREFTRFCARYEIQATSVMANALHQLSDSHNDD